MVNRSFSAHVPTIRPESSATVVAIIVSMIPAAVESFIVVSLLGVEAVNTPNRHKLSRMNSTEWEAPTALVVAGHNLHRSIPASPSLQRLDRLCVQRARSVGMGTPDAKCTHGEY